ncbi:MAG: GNAT family N-acetyltransferase, partial [Firmicutes bacterium]|nr:GNAT family N-acetyltransferase [Bacillota bacterium]
TQEDARQIAVVHVESWRTTYRGIVAADFLNKLSHGERETTWRHTLTAEAPQRRIVYVSEDAAGDITGFAMGGRHRDADPTYTGELYAIYLLEAAQGQGIGGELVREVARSLRGQGHRTMLVWVLEQNPARHFYQHLGGVPVRHKNAHIGDQVLPEVAYGWREAEFARLLLGPRYERR